MADLTCSARKLDARGPKKQTQLCSQTRTQPCPPQRTRAIKNILKKAWGGKLSLVESQHFKVTSSPHAKSFRKAKLSAHMYPLPAKTWRRIRPLPDPPSAACWRKLLVQMGESWVKSYSSPAPQIHLNFLGTSCPWQFKKCKPKN